MVTRWGAGRWWTAGGHLDTGQGQMAQDGCLTIMGSSLTFHNWYICLCPDQQINCKTYCDIAIIWGDYNSVKSGYLMRQLQWIRQNQDDTKIQSNLKLFWYLQIHQILDKFYKCSTRLSDMISIFGHMTPDSDVCNHPSCVTTNYGLLGSIFSSGTRPHTKYLQIYTNLDFTIIQ